MALNFPSTPAFGDLWPTDNPKWKFNGVGWARLAASVGELGFLHVHLSGTHTTSAGVGTVKVPLNTVVQDSLGIWDPINHEAVIAEAGLYIAVFHRTTATTAVQAEAVIGHNAVGSTVASRAWSDGATFYSGTMNLVKLEAGDKVWAGVFKGGAVGIIAAENEGFRLIGPLKASIGLPFSEGDTFPSSPVDGQKFYRTDLNLLCFYNSSIDEWLSSHVETLNIDWKDADGSISTNQRAGAVAARDDMYLVDVTFAARVAAGTNNPTNYWTTSLFKSTASDVSTFLASANTSAVAAGTGVRETVLINAAIGSGFHHLNLWVPKTGTPSALQYATAAIRYRLILS